MPGTEDADPQPGEPCQDCFPDARPHAGACRADPAEERTGGQDPLPGYEPL
jgi:hypothetical protein